MAKTRRQKSAKEPKLKTSPKGGVKRKPVLEKDPVDNGTTLQSLILTSPRTSPRLAKSSVKKQKLDTSETKLPVEKYIPRFGVTKFSLRKSSVKTSENECPQHELEPVESSHANDGVSVLSDGCELKDDAKLNKTIEDNSSYSTQEKDTGDDSLTDINETLECIISVICSAVDRENEQTELAGKKEPFSVPDLFCKYIGNTTACVTTAEQAIPVKTDEKIDDIDMIAVPNMSTDVSGPGATDDSALIEEGVLDETTAMNEVPKLSEIIKKFNENEGKKKLNKVVTGGDLTNPCHGGNEEHKGTQGSLGVNISHEIVSYEPNTTVGKSQHGSPQVETNTNSNKVCSSQNVSNDLGKLQSSSNDGDGMLVDGENEKQNVSKGCGKFKRSSTDGDKMVGGGENEKQSASKSCEELEGLSTDGDKMVVNGGENEMVVVNMDGDKQCPEEYNDQEVPAEVVRDTNEVVLGNKQKAPISSQQETLPNISTDNTVNSTNGETQTVIVNVPSDDIVDQQSFAKEFEGLEDLLPDDDMGLFDDVINDDTKSSSIEPEVLEGNKTIEFLNNELSTLNTMVLNYQRAIQDMEKRFKISSRY